MATWRQQAQRDADYYAERAYEDYQTERYMESIEAEEARHSHRMRQAAAERPAVTYDAGPDTRLHGWREAIADGHEVER